MQRHFDVELKRLNAELLEMAKMVQDCIYRSILALGTKDAQMAQAVIDYDRNIDEKELLIEERCIDLLALYQPMAKDLRFITTGLKINAELERIADLSVNISQRVLEIAGKPMLKPLIDIPKLSDVAQRMVKDAVDSFVRRDKDLARKVILSDPEADNLRNLVQQELVNDYMLKDGSTIERGVALLLIARYLERICDHATNIAEDIIYMVQAENVRHHFEKLEKNNIHRKNSKG